MENDKIWYLKYSGELVKDWSFDMRKSAEALIWFDEMLRYFISKEEPLLSNVKFELPVNINKGSWEIVLFAWLWPFIVSFANKAWKDWFLETWPAKDWYKILQWALSSIKWIIRIRNHVWEKDKTINWVKIGKNNEILIPNESWEYISVPKKIYDYYKEFPEKIFQKNTKLIEKDRILEIWSIENWEMKEVKITENEKNYFYEEDENEIVLPELVDWEYVELEGEITRTTESTNNIWLKYKWHTLICKPQDKSLAFFKDKIVSFDETHFFSKVIIKGFVNRINNEWWFKEKKPTIFFIDIENIESNNKSSLF